MDAAAWHPGKQLAGKTVLYKETHINTAPRDTHKHSTKKKRSDQVLCCAVAEWDAHKRLRDEGVWLDS